jgi:hypothetical protein
MLLTSKKLTAIWEGDLMEGNPRNPSHLWDWELWVQVVVRLIITQMCPTPCQIWVEVGWDNERTCESPFLFSKKKKKQVKSSRVRVLPRYVENNMHSQYICNGKV